MMSRRVREIVILVGALAGFMFVFISPTWAATFVVNTTADIADMTPDGICDGGSGRCTLRAAVEEANALLGPDSVILPNGKYRLANGLPPLTNADDLQIVGTGAFTTRIIGTARDRVLFNAAGATLRIEGIQIYGGAVRPALKAPGGAAIMNEGQATLVGVALDRHDANDGRGGCVYSSGELVILDSDITRCHAYGGGGVYATSTSSVVIERSRLRDNRAFAGGGAGVFAECGSRISVKQSSFFHNTARKGNTTDIEGPFDPDGGGGGLNVCGDNVTIENTSFVRDRCRRCAPGGQRIRGGAALLDSVLIKDAQAAMANAGILIDAGATVFFLNSVFEGNDSHSKAIGGRGGNCSIENGAIAISLGGNVERYIAAASGPSCGFVHAQDLTYLSGTKLFGKPSSRSNWAALPLPESLVTDFLDQCSVGVDQLGNGRPVDGDGDGEARCDTGPIESGGVLVNTPTPTPTAPATSTPTPTPTPTGIPSSPTETPTP